MRLFPNFIVLALVATVSTSTFAGVVSDVGSIPAPDAVKSEKDWSGMLGLALLSSPEYIGSGDTESSGLPLIIIDYKDTAYFKVNRGGYWFYKPSDKFRVGALIKIRPGAWEDDDDSFIVLGLPASFEEPDAQAEAGVNFLFRSGKFAFEAQLLSGEDLNVHISLSYHLIRSKQSTLTLSFAAELLGEDTVRFNWYGDDNSFVVDSAINTSLTLIGTYSLSAEWKLLYGFKGTSLDKEIENSPVGNEDTYNIGFIGAAWAF